MSPDDRPPDPSSIGDEPGGAEREKAYSRSAASGAEEAEREPREPGRAPEQPAGSHSDGDARASVQITNVSYGGNQVLADVRESLQIRDSAEAGSLDPGRRHWIRVKQGPVDRDEIDHARAIFVAPGWYPRARRSLHRGVALLHGPEGTGKRTAALNLLDDLHPEGIVAFESRDPIVELDESEFHSGYGYLIDTLVDEHVRKLTRVQLDRLAHALRRRDAHMVITFDSRSLPRDVDEQYGVSCVAPEPVRVLRAHLSHRLPPEQRGDQQEALLDDQVRQSVAEVHQPRHVVDLARELAEAARHGYPTDYALTAWREQSDEEASELLARCATAEDRAMLLATAVFEEYDYGVVVREARRLRELAGSDLGDPAERPQPPVRPLALVDREKDAPDPVYRAPEPPKPLFALPRTERLEAVGAWLLPPEVDPTGRYRLRRARFRNIHTARAVLKRVWDEHEEVRRTLLDWLGGIPFTADLYLRAAEWVGRLVGSSTGYEVLEPLTRWARSDSAKRRFMAAEALGVAAEDPVVGAHVREQLRQWEDASQALCATAALAYGHRFGLDRPKYAIERLRWIASQLEGRRRDQILPIVLDSLTRVRIQAERTPDVLREWTRWITDGRRTLREAGIAALSRLLAEEVGRVRHARASSRLLPLRAVCEGYADGLAELLRHAMDDRDAYRYVSRALFVWRDVGRERAPNDRELAAAVEEIVVALLGDVPSPGALRLAVEVEQDAERHVRRGGDHPEDHRGFFPENAAVDYSESLRHSRQVQELWLSESTVPDSARGTDGATEEEGVPTDA